MPARCTWPALLSLLSLLSLLLLGCLTPAQRRQDALVKAAREYNDGIRWRRYDRVTPHLAADEAARFLARSDAVGPEFEMADNEVESIRFAEGGERADVTVDFTWMDVRRALVRRTLVAQEWRLTDGRWICAVQRRVRGDLFPLVAEPAAQPRAVAQPQATDASASPRAP